MKVMPTKNMKGMSTIDLKIVDKGNVGVLPGLSFIESRRFVDPITPKEYDLGDRVEIVARGVINSGADVLYTGDGLAAIAAANLVSYDAPVLERLQGPQYYRRLTIELSR